MKVVNVGYSLLPALLSHKVDAVLGVYRNVEGIELKQRGYNPTIIPLDRAGVPCYDELVLVANADRLRSSKSYADMVGKFVDAFQTGQREAYIHPDRSIEILGKVTAAKRSFLEASTRATLPLLGQGCLETSRMGAVRRLDVRARPAEAARPGLRSDDEALPRAAVQAARRCSRVIRASGVGKDVREAAAGAGDERLAAQGIERVRRS